VVAENASARDAAGLSSSTMSRCSGDATPVLPGAVDLAAGTSNIAFQFNGEIAPVEAAIRSAAHVVNRTGQQPRRGRAAGNTGALGEFDASSGQMHLTASAAGACDPRPARRFRLSCPREKLRVSIPMSVAASG
jgi:carbon-monoxide dehydrogenase large subunit